MPDDLQPAGYISNANRTEEEVWEELEVLVEATQSIGARIHSGLIAIGGVITLPGPASQMLHVVDGSDIDRMPHDAGGTGYPYLMKIMLVQFAGPSTTLKHLQSPGSGGSIQLIDGLDVQVGTDPGDVSFMQLMYAGFQDAWVEVARQYVDAAGARAGLELGEAALLDNYPPGPAGGVDATFLRGNDGSNYVESTSGVAYDSARLGGSLASEFLEKTFGGTFPFNGILSLGDGQLLIKSNTDVSQSIRFFDNDDTTVRYRINYSKTGNSVYNILYDTDGTSKLSGIWFNDAEPEVEFQIGGGAPTLAFHAANMRQIHIGKPSPANNGDQWYQPADGYLWHKLGGVDRRYMSEVP